MDYVASTWSFRKDDLDVALDKISKINSVTGLELVTHEPCMDRNLEFTDNYLNELGQLIDNAGLEIITVSPYTDFLTPGKLDEEIDKAKKMINVASKLEAKYLRVFIADTSPEDQTIRDGIKLASSGLAECAKAAEKAQIKLTVETHGEYGCSISNLKSILSNLTEFNIGVTLDTGNLFKYGKDPVVATKELLQYIDYLHVKDMRISGGEVNPLSLGEGEIDNKTILNMLIKEGYSGYICPEFEGETDPEGNIEKSIDYLKSIIN